MDDFTFVMICLFFATAPIALSVLVRQSVRNSRRKIIRELEPFFKLDPTGSVISGRSPTGTDDDNLLHSFEFVKFKYGADETSRDNPAEFASDEWALAALPLIVLLTAANATAMTIILISLGSESCEIPAPTCVVDFLTDHRLLRFCFLSSYIGAYTFMIRSFFQAINNFDLTPASLFGAFNNLIFGVTLPAVLFLFWPTNKSQLLKAYSSQPFSCSAICRTLRSGSYYSGVS